MVSPNSGKDDSIGRAKPQERTEEGLSFLGTDNSESGNLDSIITRPEDKEYISPVSQLSGENYSWVEPDTPDSKEEEWRDSGYREKDLAEAADSLRGHPRTQFIVDEKWQEELGGEKSRERAGYLKIGRDREDAMNWLEENHIINDGELTDYGFWTVKYIDKTMDHHSFFDIDYAKSSSEPEEIQLLERDWGSQYQRR